MFVEISALNREFVGRELVIRIEELDVRPAGEGEGAIARGRGAGILLTNDADARVALAETARHVGAVVGRTVVDDDALPIGMRLREHALDCIGKKAGLVVDRDDDGNPSHDFRRKTA
jgi:hypothetical protein